jgi:prepilin-type N-terminal cleavage/methylation domain-containing protein
MAFYSLMDANGPKLRRRVDILVGRNARDVRDCERFAGCAFIPHFSRQERRLDAGFSLVEIMVAVLVLGIALIGMVQGVTTALSSSKESELQTVAALFAAGQVETIRAEGDLRDGTTEGDCGEGLSLYRWRQTIAAAGIDGLHEAAVVVENAKSGKTIYEVKTLLFEVPDDSRGKTSNPRRDTDSQRRRTGAR